MCSRCDGKAVAKPWKVTLGVILTLAIFVASQIFMYGQFTGEMTSHMRNDPTHKQLTEEFVSQKSFEEVIKSMNDKLDFITNYITKGK